MTSVVLSQGLPVEPTPFTVVAIPGEYGVTTKGEDASDVAHTFTNNGSSFVPQGEFRSGYAQQCASGVTDTLLFCVGETESNVYSLTVYDTAQPAFVVLVHEARVFFKGTGSGGKVFTAYEPGMLTVVAGTALYVVDVTSPKDPKITLIKYLDVTQIKGVKCSEHIAVHAVERDGVQENVHVYRFVDSILKNVATIPIQRIGPTYPSWDIKGGVFAAVYPVSWKMYYYYRAAIGDTITSSSNYSKTVVTSYTSYHVSILTDGAIAVLGRWSPGFDVDLVYDDPNDPTTVYINNLVTHDSTTMVTVEGYLYITVRMSPVRLFIVSTADWKQMASYNFDESVQLTFTQSNPPAKNNTVMLEMAD